MLLSTKHQLLGSTALALLLAAPSYLAFAEPVRDGVTSNRDASVANYGRAGGHAVLSNEPIPLPQALTDAYEETKASVERAYEKSKQFVVDSAQGRGRAEQAREQGEETAGKPVTSGGAVGAYGRAGTPDYLSQPTQPPEFLIGAYEKTKGFVKHAYEKTSEFLTQSTQRPTPEQPSSLSGT